MMLRHRLSILDVDQNRAGGAAGSCKLAYQVQRLRYCDQRGHLSIASRRALSRDGEALWCGCAWPHGPIPHSVRQPRRCESVAKPRRPEHDRGRGWRARKSGRKNSMAQARLRSSGRAVLQPLLRVHSVCRADATTAVGVGVDRARTWVAAFVARSNIWITAGVLCLGLLAGIREAGAQQAAYRVLLCQSAGEVAL